MLPPTLEVGTARFPAAPPPALDFGLAFLQLYARVLRENLPFTAIRKGFKSVP